MRIASRASSATRFRRRAFDVARTAIPELEVASDPVGPGDLIHGRVSAGTPEVRLIRYEGSPAGTVPVVLARTAPAEDGSFELEVPSNVAPTFRSTSCQLTYGVRAGSKRRSRSDPVIDVTVISPLVHVALCEAEPLHDRMIARFDAAATFTSSCRRPTSRVAAGSGPCSPRPRRSASGRDGDRAL